MISVQVSRTGIRGGACYANHKWLLFLTKFDEGMLCVCVREAGRHMRAQQHGSRAPNYD